MSNLTDWAWMTTILVQALIGNISPNQRAITLSFDGNQWRVGFYLEQESDSDREDIEQVIDDMSIYIDDLRGLISGQSFAAIGYDISINSDDLDLKNQVYHRLIYRRMEKD